MEEESSKQRYNLRSKKFHDGESLPTLASTSKGAQKRSLSIEEDKNDGINSAKRQKKDATISVSSSSIGKLFFDS